MGNLLNNLASTIKGFFSPQKIISPVSAAYSPGGYNDEATDPALNRYYELSYMNDPKSFQGNPIIPTSTATPTPTSTPTIPSGYGSNPFSDFTTAPVPPDQEQLIYNAAHAAHINADVLASVLFTEHGFQPMGNNYNRDQNGNIIPGDYDRGEAQINSVSHPEISDQQADNPQFAIPWAANTLAGHLKNLGGNYAKAIAAYNVGEGGATVNGMNGPLGPKGEQYLHKVMQGLTPSLLQQLGLSGQ